MEPRTTVPQLPQGRGRRRLRVRRDLQGGDQELEVEGVPQGPDPIGEIWV